MPEMGSVYARLKWCFQQKPMEDKIRSQGRAGKADEEPDPLCSRSISCTRDDFTQSYSHPSSVSLPLAIDSGCPPGMDGGPPAPSSGAALAKIASLSQANTSEINSGCEQWVAKTHPNWEMLHHAGEDSWGSSVEHRMREKPQITGIVL